MISDKDFKTIIYNAPLVSIDLCIVQNNCILLCKRLNEPIKGKWFTPGGRIKKNERWEDSIIRIAKSELSLPEDIFNNPRLMGVWDHFYKNSIYGDDISTHYVNIPFYINTTEKPYIKLDSQHSDYKWKDIYTVCKSKYYHKYMRIYSKYILQNFIL